MVGIEMVPSAKRLMESLRDMGYDFSQAVADIVDNSIEAGASRVDIDVKFNGDDSWIRISDNGKGMTPEALREAMRYGAEREYSPDDLGKFGLGMKTASMSQCQRLSVASRWNKDRADISAYSWDLGHIKSTNRWEILPVDRTDDNEHIRGPLKDSTGTVVLWTRLDRILGYRYPYGEAARKRLAQTCAEVEAHLAMVFHRFLAGEVRGKRLKLSINGNQIRPWDPFCRDEKETKRLQPVELPVEFEGAKGTVLLTPYVLPHTDDFSSSEAAKVASGPANWNQQQGFYIYRAGRMIQSGGWSGVRVVDEHTKLARVSMDFSPVLDAAFKINVAKMRVQLPTSIRDDIKGAVGPVIKIADETYRKSGKAGVGKAPTSDTHTTASSKPHVSGNGSYSSSAAGKTEASIPVPRFSHKEWAKRLLTVAKSHERPIVKAVLERL